MNITSATYTSNNLIEAVIDGVQCIVPNDMANRHRQAIATWEANGNTISPYTPPAPSTDPNTYELQPWQFWATVEMNNLTTQINDVIAAMTDANAKAIAQAKLNHMKIYQRSDPLFDQIGTAIGMTSAQIDALWLQAKDLS